MAADRKWVEKNLGFDPIATPPPRETFTVKRIVDAAVKKTAKVAPEDFQREIIDFDSEGTEGREFMAFSTSTGPSRFTDIPWPKGLAPQTGSKLVAVQIYKGFGRWSTVCSAIACRASIVAEP
ncbi:hypothetical protein [Bradyrhizobium sp. BR13661]|jgi:hypothetical protein|uniref:hypothetical protein n=1 Tax=Bradyrhizobium sp. BR13661 TaxID=2940622 RepID=UPI002473B931|nr:hypothetical protein [Bradyrhizobium sp. BR13661]MDH6263938.1 hypothetical protein [Bradyrhizobium sp. BR13661]